MEFVDTHSHLFSEEFDSDKRASINRALDARVRTILLPNIDVETIGRLKEFSDLAPQNCLPMMGLHPCSVTAKYKEQLSHIEAELFSDYKYYGVGEIGLDFYWDKTFAEEQRIAFVQQCTWAAELDLGVSIHTRSATYDAIAAIKTMKQKPRGIFHCFSGSYESAKEIINAGFYLGIGGVVTYKNAGLVNVLSQIDLEHLVLETDAPYLSPVPFRGKRNESSYLKYIVEKVAEIKNCSVETVAKITSENAEKIFGS